MGMRDELSEALAEAFDDAEGLADAVQAFQGVRQIGQSTYDPVTETMVPSLLTYDGRGIFGGYAVEMIDGVRVLATDVRLLILQGELDEVPAVGDKINGLNVLVVGKDPVSATWTLQLRRV